jgi:N-acyl-D-aspartate/D-glutamate deacylase
MAVGTPRDLADMFCRVEGIPRSTVLPLLEDTVDWDHPRGYLAHLARLPLGPHVACMLGHSTLRAHVLGLDRSLDDAVEPTERESQRMDEILEESLDAGYLGLSINTLPWDKMDGTEHRSKPTPSVFATWTEYRRLMRVLRRRERILQGVPNLATRVNFALFFLASTALGRKPLRTTLLALMDPKSDRLAHRIVGGLTRFVNAWLGADVRLQALPNPFDLWTDGLENPVIEEFGAGTAALHVQDEEARSSLLRDPAYRARFRKDWQGLPGNLGQAWHRDLQEARIVRCPEASLNGLTFAEVAASRGSTPLDTFLDLMATHGRALRWYTVVANDRPERLAWILRHPDILVGFSDAGAHLRNMAYYNFGPRLLWRVRQAEAAGNRLMTPGQAIHRLSGEIADWLGIEAGHLEVGARADVVVLDPAGLTEAVEALHEAPMPGFSSLQRLVRRNDDAVRKVYISGRLAWSEGAASPTLGAEQGFGTVLRAR